LQFKSCNDQLSQREAKLEPLDSEPSVFCTTMSSLASPEVGTYVDKEDDPMRAPEEDEDEGEGDAIIPGDSDDSSEEPEDDAEEERRIKEGFIVDEDEDEDDDDERKRHKKRHRKRKREYA
jgi:transcription elongation factor SPT6